MHYTNELVEKIVMDLASCTEELEAAWRNNPCAVKQHIVQLHGVAKSTNQITINILRNAS